MALTNVFGDLALDTSIQDVKTSVDNVNTTLTSGIDITSSALPTGAATDATLIALQSLQQQIVDLNENLLGVMSAIFNAMPRITANKQAAISIESGIVNTVTNQTQIGGQDALSVARNQMMAGTQHIYTNLMVS